MYESIPKEKSILIEAMTTYCVDDLTQKELYHNTLYLLRHYSKVSWRITSAAEELNEVCVELVNRSIMDIVDTAVDLDPRIKTERIKSRLQSLEYSKSIINYIDESLMALRKFPKHGEKYYLIIYKSYINKSGKAIEYLAEEYNMSRATLFREKKKAIDIFGVILWGYLFQ
jgi:hypothetical protein